MGINSISLDESKSKQLAEDLNDLLANYQIFYMNVRGFHWNVKGNNFFELHLKFEELYNDALLKVDEIAERILTLGYTPLHSFSDYVKISEIKELTGISDGIQGVNEVLSSFKVLLKKERKILDLSGELNDEGTSAIMGDYIRQQEKFVWMYSAYLGNK